METGAFQLLRNIQDLNFTYDLFLVEDNKFGSVDNNGNWDGMIGALVNGGSIKTGTYDHKAFREGRDSLGSDLPSGRERKRHC